MKLHDVIEELEDNFDHNVESYALGGHIISDAAMREHIDRFCSYVLDNLRGGLREKYGVDKPPGGWAETELDDDQDDDQGTDQGADSSSYSPDCHTV